MFAYQGLGMAITGSYIEQHLAWLVCSALDAIFTIVQWCLSEGVIANHCHYIANV